MLRYHSETQSETTLSNISESTVWYISGSASNLTYHQDVFYRIDNKYYKQKTSETITPTPSTNNNISIYVNNTTLDKTEQTTTPKGYSKRLFSCIKKGKNNKINNIFSILDNGTLYIGG